jgi:hypothetical protein
MGFVASEYPQNTAIYRELFPRDNKSGKICDRFLSGGAFFSLGWRRQFAFD